MFLDSNAKTCTTCTNVGINNVPSPAAAFCTKCDQAVNLCDPDGCVEGNYFDDDEKRCLACVGNAIWLAANPTAWQNRPCLKCSGSAKCDECNTGYYRDSSGLCVSCTVAYNCRTCGEANKCTTCDPGFYLDTTTQKCEKCTAPNSVTCSGFNTATSCAATFFLNNVLGTCTGKCGNNCNRCANSGNNAGNCGQCITNFGPSFASPTTCV